MTGAHLCCATWGKDMLQFLFPGESWAVLSEHWELQMFLPRGTFHSPLVPDHYLELGRELCLDEASQKRAPLLNYPLYKSRDAILPPGWDFTSIHPSLPPCRLVERAWSSLQTHFTTGMRTACCGRGEGWQDPRSDTCAHTPSPAQSHPSQPLSLVLAKGSSPSEPQHTALLSLLAGIIHCQEFLGWRRSTQSSWVCLSQAREGPPGDFLGAEEEQLHSSAQCQPLSRV